MVNRLTGKHTKWDLLGIKAFDFLKTTILASQNIAFAEEDVYGESSEFKKIWYYHCTYLFGLLMKLRTQENSQNYSTISSTYQFEKIKKALACNGINFDDLLTTLGIVKDNSETGISDVAVTDYKVGISQDAPQSNVAIDMRQFIEDKAECLFNEDIVFVLEANGSAVEVNNTNLIQL